MSKPSAGGRPSGTQGGGSGSAQPQPRGSTVSAMNPAASSGRTQPPPGSTLQLQQQQQQRPAAIATAGSAAPRNTPSPIPPPATSLGSGPVSSSASAAYLATGSAPNSARGADSTARPSSSQNSNPQLSGGGGGGLSQSRSTSNLSTPGPGPTTLALAAPPLSASASFAPCSPSSGTIPMPVRQRGNSEIVTGRSGAPMQRGLPAATSAASATAASAAAGASGGSSAGPATPSSSRRSRSNSFSGPHSSCPNWGPVLFPPPLPAPPAASSGSETARGLSTLYQRSPSPVTVAAALVPFAPPPVPAQNLCDNAEFYELYKAVWAMGFHGIHDGIERPAVLSLLPARVFWAGKRVLDIGCGAGHLCRQMRKAHARLVVGVDSSVKMLTVARAREAQEEAAHRGGLMGQGGLLAGLTGSSSGSGGSSLASHKGVGHMLKKLFGHSKGGGGGGGGDDSSELNEAQMAEKLEKEKRRILARRAQEKLKAEDEARENMEAAKSLAAATLAAEKEAERADRESDGTTDNGAHTHHKSGFLSKLFKKEARNLKPSSEAENYVREAEAKKLQREHEERILRAAAAAEAARNGQPIPPELLDDLCAGSSSTATPPPFIPCKFVHSTFEEWAPSAEIITAAAPPGAAAAAAAGGAGPAEDGALFDLITCCMTLQFIWDLKGQCAAVRMGDDDVSGREPTS